MATNRPSGSVLKTAPVVAAAEENVGVQMVNWVHSVICGLHGHDNLLQFGRGRMFLKCVSCGHESPGWTIKERQAAGVVAVAAQKRWRFLPQFAGLKRAA